MGHTKLYECRGCVGRDLTMQACEAVIRSAAELKIVENFADGTVSAQLPQGFCGDKHARGLMQVYVANETATAI